MGDGTKLAIAIALLFVAMVAFFFAFHPGGVANVSDPDAMLQWLTQEFNIASSDPGDLPANAGTDEVDVNVANAKNGKGTPEQTVRASVSPSNG